MERWLTAEHEPTAPGRDYEHMFSAASLPSNSSQPLTKGYVKKRGTYGTPLPRQKIHSTGLAYGEFLHHSNASFSIQCSSYQRNICECSTSEVHILSSLFRRPFEHPFLPNSGQTTAHYCSFTRPSSNGC